MAINPLIGASAISAGASLLGNAQQSSNIQAQIKAQAEENEKTRKYNFMLAKWQHEKSLEQWNRENEYNTPSAQMQRYLDAGLNPDLIYNESNLSASSPQLATPAPAVPQDMSPLGQRPTIGQALQNAVRATHEMAETALVKTDNDVKEKELEWYDIKAGLEVDLGTMEMLYKDSETQLNDEQRRVLPWQIEELKTNISYVGEKINEVRKNMDYIDARTAREKAETLVTPHIIDELVARTHFEYAHAKSMLVDCLTNLLNGQEYRLNMRGNTMLLGWTGEEIKSRIVLNHFGAWEKYTQGRKNIFDGNNSYFQQFGTWAESQGKGYDLILKKYGTSYELDKLMYKSSSPFMMEMDAFTDCLDGALTGSVRVGVKK